MKRRNADGGPKTHLFALDIEREYEIARRATPADKPDLLDARLVLADQVASYRRSGQVTEALLAACERELALSDPQYSKGMRRICELAADGSPAALERAIALFKHPRGSVRSAMITGHGPLALPRSEVLKIARDLLTDRSARVQIDTAIAAVSSHWPELAEVCEEAGVAAAKEVTALELFTAAHQLRRNEQTGYRGGYRWTVEDRHTDEAARQAFLDRWRDNQTSTGLRT